VEPVEISAGRLHLRPWQESDEDAVYAACQDPEIQRWTRVPVPYTRADAHDFVTHRSPHGWEAGTAATWAVVDSTSGELLASMLLFDIAEGSAEVGYWCAPSARRQGVTTDAVAAVCRWGFEALGLDRIEWAAGVGNYASLAIAQKCGFTYEGLSRRGLVQRGQRQDGWWCALLSTDEVVDRRPLPPPPTLTDGVVTLRPWLLSDAEDLTLACRDSVIGEWLPIPSPYTREHAAEFLTSTVGSWLALGKRMPLAVADPGSGRLLGSVGLNTEAVSRHRASVGYWTAPWGRGRGVAPRAASLLTAWAFDVLGVDRVELLADVDNAASQRVAEKAGFAREGLARGARRDGQGTARDMVVLSRIRSDPSGETQS
jgi:RimJ/RimL family protein N-acetyltransferase